MGCIHDITVTVIRFQVRPQVRPHQGLHARTGQCSGPNLPELYLPSRSILLVSLRSSQAASPNFSVSTRLQRPSIKSNVNPRRWTCRSQSNQRFRKVLVSAQASSSDHNLSPSQSDTSIEGLYRKLVYVCPFVSFRLPVRVLGRTSSAPGGSNGNQ